MLCGAVGLETRHLDALPGTGAGLSSRRPGSSTRWRRSSPNDGAGAQADGAQARGLAGRVAHGQLLAAAQPRVQALGVARQLDPRDGARIAARAGIRSMPGSRWMKNGSHGSAIACATPARRAVRPRRSMLVTLEPEALAWPRTSSTATAQPKRPSGAAATARPMTEAAASSGSAMASSSR